MVSIAFYGGLPGGISTPIVQQSREVTEGKDSHTIFKPYCSDTISTTGNKMARNQEEKPLREDKEEPKGRNDWWKIGMLLLCLMAGTTGLLWWYEGQQHTHFIGLVAVGGKLNGSGQTNAIECWGSFPGCRPFNNYFSFKTNRTINTDNNTATLLDSYHREITYIYKTSCLDSDHCQEYNCIKVNITNSTEAKFWGFEWLECNQTENAKSILIPSEEMVRQNNDSWIPKGCNETWAKVKHCPMDLLYGIHPIRLCVQPPFFLVRNPDNDSQENGSISYNNTLSNCGPPVYLGVLEDNKAVVQNGSCTVYKIDISRPDYTGQYIMPVFYNCSFENVTPCINNNDSSISVIMSEKDNIQYLLCKNSSNEGEYTCVVQSFGVIGLAHLELPRKNKKIKDQQFTTYNCSVNNKTELKEWQLVKTSGITPFPLSSESRTGLVRYKRDFGLSAIIASIIAATAIAASVTMSYVALTEANKVMDVTNHTFKVENGIINSTEMLEKQVQILYAMILQTHADVQLLKEKQKVAETFDIIGCVERSHVFCHTGHPWNETWGQINDTTQWDDWVTKMDSLSHQILSTLHATRNNLEQSMITFNTPDSIAQFGKSLWSHVANWIPGLGASIVKYAMLFVVLYLVLTSMPKILRNLWTTTTGAGSSVSHYLRKKYYHRRASQEDSWVQDQYNIHLANVTDGSDIKSNSQKQHKNNWSGASGEYNRRLDIWRTLTKASGENYNGLGINMETTLLSRAVNEKNKDAGEKKAHLGSLDVEIQSEGGNIYDCCIKAQEGTLAIPCCGFPLWLFWGLLIIMGRLIGYGLRGLALVISICVKGLTLLLTLIKKGFDFIGEALNPATSHISMPQYV
uniref:Envelope glycoprotein n=1 Tax=Equine infectious anemia virus TaxID=11665 RepID=A0A411K833_9RETR|nr:env polyprotein [Equine infectious anemia virus]